MSDLRWDNPHLLFDQLETLIRARLRAAQDVQRSPSIITDDGEYKGKIEAFQQSLSDIRTMRRLWVDGNRWDV